MNVLVVAPHADDEILGVGGTIARYVSEGHDVYVCVVTSGHPLMFPKSMLEKLRNEALEAHRYLGVKQSIFLDFPAVMLNEIPRHEINAKISDVIQEIKPEIIYIPHHGDMHLDHYIVSQSTMVGARPVKDFKVREIYSFETLSETEWNIPHANNAFLPNTFINISDFIDKKIKAMGLYTTQLHAYPHPRSIEAIEYLAKIRGATVGVNAAEAFCSIRRII